MGNAKSSIDLLLSLLDRLVGTDGAFVTSVFERLLTEESYTFSPGEMNKFTSLAHRQMDEIIKYMAKQATKGNNQEARRALTRYKEIDAALQIRAVLEQYTAAIYKRISSFNLTAEQRRKLERIVLDWRGKGLNLAEAAKKMPVEEANELFSEIQIAANQQGKQEIKPASLPRLKKHCEEIRLLQAGLLGHNQNKSREMPRKAHLRRRIR